MSHDNETHGLGTQAIHAGMLRDEYGSVMPAIYQTSTFAFDSTAQGAARFKGADPGYIYTRWGNPTIRMLERNIAALEGGADALACSSGMAASNSMYFALLAAGAHVVASDSIYAPTRTVVEKHWSRFGVEYSFVDMADLSAVRAALRANTKLLYIETPANPNLKVSDIAACAALAHKRGALLAVDSTFMSPILQRPLAHGADIVVHSITKFLNGHSDVVGGVLVFQDPALAQQLRLVWRDLGGTMDPHQAWLVLRGIKTLKMRVLTAQANAIAVAQLLAAHPAVVQVYFPALASAAQRGVHDKQASGPGSLISFELQGGLAAGAKLMDSLKLMTLAVSLGGVETLIQHPASMTHHSLAPDKRLAAGISDGLVRLSVGCEDVEDLLADLDQGLAQL